MIILTFFLQLNNKKITKGRKNEKINNDFVINNNFNREVIKRK